MSFTGACVVCGTDYTVTSERRAIKNSHKCVECRRGYIRIWRRARLSTDQVWRAELAAKARRDRVDPNQRLQIWARRQVKWALSHGLLSDAPCERCGDIRTEAHHDDYRRPLDVRWLCVMCHTAHHGTYLKAQAEAEPEPVVRMRTVIEIED